LRQGFLHGLLSVETEDEQLGSRTRLVLPSGTRAASQSGCRIGRAAVEIGLATSLPKGLVYLRTIALVAPLIRVPAISIPQPGQYPS
jgi:hypothetical protein